MPVQVLPPLELNLTPVRQFSRGSRHHFRNDGGVSLHVEKRPVWKDHVGKAATLVDVHLHDPEQSTSVLLAFTYPLFDALPLFICQMGVVAPSVTDPAPLVRRHYFIMHP